MLTSALATAMTALSSLSCLTAQQAIDGPPEETSGPSWALVWSDEFDGTVLDGQKWAHRAPGPRRDGWWSPAAVQLDGNGHLVISTTREDAKYVSGSVATDGKFHHRFGLFVTRVQFQTQPGHWPAFWLTASGVTTIGNQGRDGTEIDIVEKAWLGDTLQHALHWDGYGPELQSSGHQVTVSEAGRGFHTFALVWTPTDYVFFVDGKETWRTAAGGVSQAPQYLVLSDEVGAWAGNISDAMLPDQVVFDYVRVYDCVFGDQNTTTPDLCGSVDLPVMYSRP